MLTHGRVGRAPPSVSDVLSPLPRWFVHAVFLLLPVDTRLRCCEVDRAWRALLADATLFSCLNLSASSGVARFSLPLFRAAVAKAGGQLRALDVSGHGDWPVTLQTLRDVLVANANTLKELRVVASYRWFGAAQVMALLEAGRSLERLELNLGAITTADAEQCSRYLRSEPPFASLRLRGLAFDGRGLDSPARVKAIFADLHKQQLLEHLEIRYASFNDAATMRVFVDAALKIESILLWGCQCMPATVPELTRLVSGAARRISIYKNGVELFQAGADTDAFCAAVRASERLTRLALYSVGPNLHVAAAAVFINAQHL